MGLLKKVDEHSYIQIHRRVGGGGGHALYVNNFRMEATWESQAN
jgi:hypothetical protein